MIVTDKNKLKEKCLEVSVKEGEEIGVRLLHELRQSESGIGLAANQIGINKRVCVIKKTLALKSMDEFFGKQRVSTGRPPGWHFMNEYVDKDGNVFHKGKEQPDLKGTLEPTKVKPRKKKKKLTEEQKLKRDIDRWNKRKKARKGKK